MERERGKLKMTQQFYNIGKGIMFEQRKGNKEIRFDLRIVGVDQCDEIKAFSLTDEEMNIVLQSLNILDKRRFGNIKEKE